jgi:predicted phosphodiesterase
MRIALLSDIHGNSLALDAVLADIQAQGGVDQYWVLGDLAAIGPDPVGVLDRLVALPQARFILGNTDTYLVTDKLPWPTIEAVQADPRLLPIFKEVSQSFAWTQGALTAAGLLEWLVDLPDEQRAVLPDGTRLLGVHAVPGNNDGSGFHPNQSENERLALLSGCEADIVFVGHTHTQMDVCVGEIRLVNLGSVSNPFPPDLRASYVMLAASLDGYWLEHRRVDYDRQAVITAIQRQRNPSAEYVTRFMLGQNRPGWGRRDA